MGKLLRILTRKKALDPISSEETQLNRVLNTFDLTALGVGSTLGVGVYVLTGQVAKDIAGPSVILSFLIAAVASVFAALCYAEFGARAPRAGSAYIYSYVCVGELVAFVIGWNLILEYVIGSASVARGLSGYLDSLINNTLQDTFRQIAPINVDYMSAYFDFFAFGISVLLAAALAIGVKESSIVNNIVTVLNVGVVLFVIIAGSLKANVSNWNVEPNATIGSNSTAIVGQGGFFPFGFEGMIKGAAKCFYAFVGFDAIATTGEEVKNPTRAIPIAILVSLFISFCAYFGTSTVLTLMVPYYLQDENAPLPVAFEDVGWGWAKWVVAVGAMFGLCASLFGAMFPLPRIIFAMGSDGLVFKFLAKVHSRFRTPFVGTMLAGLLTGLMAALFKLEHLVNMMSIGTLLAYTIVAASVLLLRYAEERRPVYHSVKTTSDSDCESDGSESEKYSDDYGKRHIEGINSEDQDLIEDDPVTGLKLLHVFNCYREISPNKVSEKIVATEVFIYCLLCVLIGLCGRFLIEDIKKGEVWAISLASVVVGLAVIVFIMMLMQPTSKKELSFRVPLVPLVPALSILVNVYLMMMLDSPTWIRFGVWMALGIPMYIYCICDCGRGKIPPGTQAIKNAVSDSTSSTLKLSNGLSNPTFVNDANDFVMVPTKKRKAPVPSSLSPTSEKSESIEIQQQAVIAQLDEILDKEAAISQLDEVLEKETVRLNEHRLSDGTLSNMSAIVTRKEDVVADVHRDNVLATPPADPKSNPLYVYVGTFEENNPDFDDNKDPKQVSDDEGINLSLCDENIAASYNDEDASISSAAVTFPQDTNDQPSLLTDKKQTSLEPCLGATIDQETSTHVIPLPPDLPEEIGKSKIEFYSGASYLQNKITDNSKLKESMSTASPVEKYIKSSKSNNKNFESTPLFESLSEESPRTPTEAALKSVTLRKVKKELKELEPYLKESTASETNLRVGSQEYQQFRENLNNKLKRMTVIPTFAPIPKKDTVVVPYTFEPNKNVIEEHIDKNDAMLKLQTFLNSQVEDEIEAEHRKFETKKRFLSGEDRSKSVDDNLLKSHPTSSNEVQPRLAQVDKIIEKIDEIKHESAKENTELYNHKEKIKIVLDNINLNHDDLAKRNQLKRRLSKSLGSSFLKYDDQTVHRRKMDNIFGSITAMRKNSLSQSSTDWKEKE